MCAQNASLTVLCSKTPRHLGHILFQKKHPVSPWQSQPPTRKHQERIIATLGEQIQMIHALTVKPRSTYGSTLESTGLTTSGAHTKRAASTSYRTGS